MNSKVFFSVLAACLLLITFSCKKDDPEPESDTPVLGSDFNFTVNGNTVTFTTTLTGNVWFKDETTGVEYTAVEGTVDVFIATTGTYPFTCNVLVEGAPVASEPFNVEITQDDLGFLESELWKNLSGGIGKTKSWKMDMSPNGPIYFDSPLYYSGHQEGDAKTEEYSYWAWDLTPDEVNKIEAGELTYDVAGTEMSSIYNWKPAYAGNEWLMAAADYGTITFKGEDMTVSTNVFGETKSGGFSFDTTTMKLTLNGVILPTDTARINEPQFKEEYQGEVRIFSLSDSSMQIGIRRSYDGIKEDGSHPEDPWLLIYNFICADYTYPVPEKFTYTEPVKATVTANDLVGTWKFAPVPFNWIGWKAVGDQGTTIEASLLNEWNVATDVADWAAPQDSLAAAADNEYVFNADGTCTLNGVANNFTVASGVVTLTTALTNEFTINWVTLAGSELKIYDIGSGVWIGTQNEAKMESIAFNLVKK